MSDPEKLKVGEIFVAAGAAFTKMAELITSLQKVGEASTSSGKWSLQEIQMLQSAVKPFIAELRRIQSTVQSHNDSEVISSVRDATDFIDLKESSTESDKKPSNDKEMALNTAVSLPPKRNLTLNMLNATESEVDVESFPSNTDNVNTDPAQHLI